MSRRPAEAYVVVCDGCGIEMGEEPSAEGRCWFANDMKPQDYDAPDEHGWLIDAPGDWCSRCRIYDEDRDEYRPPSCGFYVVPGHACLLPLGHDQDETSLHAHPQVPPGSPCRYPGGTAYPGECGKPAGHRSPHGPGWYPVECEHGYDACPTCDTRPATPGTGSPVRRSPPSRHFDNIGKPRPPAAWTITYGCDNGCDEITASACDRCATSLVDGRQRCAKCFAPMRVSRLDAYSGSPS